MESDRENLYDSALYQDLMKRLAELSKTANMDDLTKMLNRRAGKQRLRKYMKKAHQEHRILSVVLCDINELKSVNDTYGHNEGDRLLKYTSSVLKKSLGPEDFAFRLSGDEFVVVFYDTAEEKADAHMKELQKRLTDGREENSIFYQVSFSYGITVVFPEEMETVSVSGVLGRADEIMYVQKRNYHIMRAKRELRDSWPKGRDTENFQYDKEHLYEALLGGTDDYIFVGNLKTGAFRYPPAMVREFGLPGEVVENASALWGELVHPHDACYFLESNEDIAEGRAESHNIEYRAKNAKGEWVWLRCRGRMIRDANGIPDMFAGMITNLGNRNKIDHMTGLPNRFAFEGEVKSCLAGEKPGPSFGILMLDMDSFKDINDLYNRSFGDEVLRITARKISSVLPSNAKIYRMDGDEFGILILNGTEGDAKKIFGKIQHIFHKQQEYNGRKYYCTLSAGGVFYPKDGDNYLDLLKYANYSLEVSKSAGKNNCTIFSKDIIKDKERSLELTGLLRECVERGFVGFSVEYQPQVDSVTGELYGAEALARWSCTKYGRVSPMEFIPLLEKSGLIIPVGEWIFRQAAIQCKKWCGFKPDFHMSINMSYIQLTKGGLLSFIEKAMEEAGVNPGNITMELTETYFAMEDQEILEIMENMRRRGMRIAMDDFGVGYSSLFILKSIPVDIVKIDREFVKNIEEDSFNAAFIHSITALCHTVEKKVCLEGVETENEYQAAKKTGLELIQGYFFGKPMEAEVFQQKYFPEK